MRAFFLKSIIMAERKLSYSDSANKKAVREFLFSLFAEKQLNKIVGLAGPDITDYLSFCKSKGYNEFEIYENHIITLANQLKMMKNETAKVQLTYGDILNAATNQEALYDLDYCVTARFMKKHLSKFNSNFIMTFARRITDAETFSTFFKARKEKLTSALTLFSPLEHTILTTDNENKYVYVKYRDTSNMCCFAKIN